REWFVRFDRVFEIGAEAAVFPFAEPGLLRVFGTVKVGHRISLSAQDKRHRVPRHVDRPLPGLWIPIARFGSFSDAVRANKDRLIGGESVHVVVCAKLKTGVL